MTKLSDFELQKVECENSTGCKCADCDYFNGCHLLKSIEHWKMTQSGSPMCYEE